MKVRFVPKRMWNSIPQRGIPSEEYMSFPACNMCIRCAYIAQATILRTLNLKEKWGKRGTALPYPYPVADCNLGFLSFNDVLYPARRLQPALAAINGPPRRTPPVWSQSYLFHFVIEVRAPDDPFDAARVTTKAFSPFGTEIARVIFTFPHLESIRGENDFAEGSKILLDMEIILLDH